MTTYFSGSIQIEVEPDGTTPDNRERFKGRIILADGREWRFDDLASGVGGCKSEMEIAESALSFASYYSTGNRGDDVPEWAPPGDLASDIGDEADYAPEGISLGETEEGDAYFGSCYAIFDSRESQARFYKEWRASSYGPSLTE